MKERAGSIKVWGGRIGRMAGAMAMAGGLAASIWGAAESGEALLTQPGYADYPEQSTSSPDYMRDAQYNTEQASAGMDKIALGVPVVLAGLAIHTMALTSRRETEQL